MPSVVGGEATLVLAVGERGEHVANSPTTTPVPPDDSSWVRRRRHRRANIHSFGADQEVTPAQRGHRRRAERSRGDGELVDRRLQPIRRDPRLETISTTLMDVDPGFSSSEPRVIFDDTTGRFWVTVTEVPDTGCAAGPVLLAVSGSSNPLPFTSWLVYSLPIATGGTTYTDEPGLGGDNEHDRGDVQRLQLQRRLPGKRDRHPAEVRSVRHDTGSNSLDRFTSERVRPATGGGVHGPDKQRLRPDQ